MRKNRCIRQKRHKKIKILFLVTVVVSIIVGCSVFVSKNVNPMIMLFSNEKVKALTTEAVGDAILEVMSESGDVEFMTVVRNENDKIVNIEIDSVVINELSQKITVLAQKKINKLGSDGIQIPIGSLSGITLFTGLGPDINVKIYLVGSTRTQIYSVFTDTGINQTLHRLYFNISGSVAVAVPGLPSSITTNAQVLMSEMIIIGDVPPTYLNATSIGDMLDFVGD